MKRLHKTTMIAMLIVVLVGTTGCPRRGSMPDDADLDRAGRDGRLGDSALGGSSLERAKRGLSPQEDGVLGDVRFGYDAYGIDGGGQMVLDSNLGWLRDHDAAKVELEGHCDDRGTIEYNLALGARRAKTVKDYLVNNGIAANRIATISYGEELPVCDEQAEGCWARNRRVHFVILTQ